MCSLNLEFYGKYSTYIYFLNSTCFSSWWNPENVRTLPNNLNVHTKYYIFPIYHQSKQPHTIASTLITRVQPKAQAALMYDAVFVLADAFTKLLKKKHDPFRPVGSKKVAGHVTMSSSGGNDNATNADAGALNNANSGNTGRGGVECNLTKPMIDAWEHGDKISRYLRKVS